MGDVVGIARPLRSRRLLALAGDARLVDQVRRGNEAAFEVIFERHGPAILAFCRHMLGSPEEAEDAVQHSFAAAYRDLRRPGRREIALKPWLFAIARNRCLSLLRARREQPVGEPGAGPSSLDGALATAGLAEQVEQRAELRRLLADLADLPHEQRAALLLAELGDLSHAEVAGVLGCEVARVKALVFRARSGLIARREARDTPCVAIREQLANLRGGSLRRTELRLHLRECPGCRAYRDEVRLQRRMLAAALPVVPTLGLKSSVLAAVGLGGGSAGGLSAAAGALSGATLAKVAVVGVLAGGGALAGEAVVDSGGPAGSAPARPAAAPGSNVNGSGDGGARAVGPGEHARGRSVGPPDPSARGRRSTGVGRFMPPDRGKTRPTPRGAVPPGQAKPERGRRRGQEGERGRGPIEAPPASTPVRRGPPEKAAPPAPQTNPKPPPPGNAVAPRAKPEAPVTPVPELSIPAPRGATGKANSGR
jgi:RNA polymerase sigma factor (sigma-70 family)